MMIFDDDEDEDESEVFFFAEALFRIDMRALRETLSRALRAEDASEDVENTSSSSTK
jgi:hypothetical protein